MFVSGDSEDVYALGHIKDSVEMYAHHLHHADITGTMHCAPLFRCIDDAEHYVGGKGISNDMTIIAYDDFKGPNATGVYYFFKSFGHKNVKVLNGGRAAIMDLDPAQKEYDAINDELKAEKKTTKEAEKELKAAKKGEVQLSDAQIAELTATVKAGKEKQKVLQAKLDEVTERLLVVKGEEHTEAKKYHISKDDLDLSYIAGKEEVKHAMEDILKNGENSKYVIVDSRGMAEIIGERKMDNVARGGHIPGATFLEWKKISDLENKLSFKKAEEMQAVFDQYKITPDKTVYAYCQVGAGRSTEIITALKLLGYKNVKAYTGSWDEWGNDMNLPLKR
jgi:thiosulfate/3-mercaptopyruvate sulfurtransferase